LAFLAGERKSSQELQGVEFAKYIKARSITSEQHGRAISRVGTRAGTRCRPSKGWRKTSRLANVREHW
jgi:hypothetical protein